MTSPAKPPTARESRNPSDARSGRALLRVVRFTRDHRVYSAGDELRLRAGVNLLVGDQGSGKSTLLGALDSLGNGPKKPGGASTSPLEIEADRCRIFSRDFEADNPRTASHLTAGLERLQLTSRFQSHGETVLLLLEQIAELLEREQGDSAILSFDEPDMALSPRSALRLVELMNRIADMGHQVIAAVHNPLVMQEIGAVYSLEHRRWLTADRFLELQRQPAKATPGKTRSKSKTPRKAA